jgi:hypothetical protein
MRLRADGDNPRGGRLQRSVSRRRGGDILSASWTRASNARGGVSGVTARTKTGSKPRPAQGGLRGGRARLTVLFQCDPRRQCMAPAYCASGHLRRLIGRRAFLGRVAAVGLGPAPPGGCSLPSPRERLARPRKSASSSSTRPTSPSSTGTRGCNRAITTSPTTCSTFSCGAIRTARSTRPRARDAPELRHAAR